MNNGFKSPLYSSYASQYFPYNYDRKYQTLRTNQFFLFADSLSVQTYCKSNCLSIECQTISYYWLHSINDNFLNELLSYLSVCRTYRNRMCFSSIILVALLLNIEPSDCQPSNPNFFGVTGNEINRDLIQQEP